MKNKKQDTLYDYHANMPKPPQESPRRRPASSGERRSGGDVDQTRPIPLQEQSRMAAPQDSRAKRPVRQRPVGQSVRPVQQPAPVIQSRQPSPKKKRKNPFRRFLRKLCLFVVFVFVLYSAAALWLIGKIEKKETGTRASISADLLSDSHVQNILLIGSDSRDTERGRSDSMILLSLNSQQNKLVMTSFMRDSFVTIPGYGDGRLNAAFSYGGAELLMDTIEQNFHVEVNDYVQVDFFSFISIIDGFGGVEITLSDAEAQAVNEILHNEVNGLMGDAADADYLSGGGTLRLNGKQALSYSRIRYVGNSDFERTSRQREVLTQLFQELKTPNLAKIGSVISEVAPSLTTNMTTGELYTLSLKAPFLLGYSLEQLRIPAEGTYSGVTVGDAAVLQIDFAANIEQFRAEVYGE